MNKKYIPYRTKLRRTKFSWDKIFRRTKFKSPIEIFVTFVRQKILSIANFVLFLKSRQWALSIIYGDILKKKFGQNFRRTKFFVEQNFRHLPKFFSPIRYVLFKQFSINFAL